MADTDTRIDEIVDGIYRISTWQEPYGITFNQFLIADERPALIHTGMHHLYDAVNGAIAQVLERAEPDLVVSDMAKARRRGKVFVDWSQNDEHKTTVNVYSVRARERPTVSAPVTWDEVRDCLDAGDAGVLTFDTEQVLGRVEELGDLFSDAATLRQRLPSV